MPTGRVLEGVSSNERVMHVQCVKGTNYKRLSRCRSTTGSVNVL